MWWMRMAGVLFFLLFSTMALGDHIETGELEYVVVTDDHDTHGKWLLLLPDGSRLELESPSEIHGWTGKKVRIRGEKKNDHTLYVHELLEADGSPALANDLPPPPAPDENIGALKAAVLFVDFQDKLETAVTTAAVQSAVDTITEPYYFNVSDQQTTLTLDVYGKYTLPYNHHCVLSDLIKQAIAAADADVNFLDYQFVTVVSPTSCGYGGIALLGRTSITTADGIIRAGYSNNITTSGATRMAQIVVHELGHNFRAHHSGFITCGGQTLASGYDACNLIEYGNPYSVMGASANVGPFDAPQKAFVGFYLEGVDYLTVTAPGRFTVVPHDTNADGLRGLRIRRGLVNDLWIEARESPAFVTKFPTSDFNKGALLTVSDSIFGGSWSPGKPLLLDASPATASTSSAALLPGTTWVDPATGTQVACVERSANALVVDVVPGTTDLVAPTASFVSPASGAAVSGTITVSVSVTEENLSSVQMWPASNQSLIQKLTAPPFDFLLDTTKLANGTQSLTIRVRDKVANTRLFGRMIQVQNAGDVTPPTCTMTAPANGATLTTSPVTLAASATDAGGIKQVQLFLDETLQTTDTVSPYTTTAPVSDGSHTAHAICEDNAGNKATSATVNFSKTAPPAPPTACTITSPLNGASVTRRSTVPVIVSTNGSRIRVTDNGVQICSDSATPFSCSLFTGNGRKSHSLQAFCSNVGSVEIASPIVNVRNQ